MAQEPLKPAYVIWGEDRATIDRALVRLVARVEREGGMAPERFRAEESPPEDVVAACEALSFAGLRLVLVDGADAWKADAAGALLAYLAAPSPAMAACSLGVSCPGARSARHVPGLGAAR